MLSFSPKQSVGGLVLLLEDFRGFPSFVFSLMHRRRLGEHNLYSFKKDDCLFFILVGYLMVIFIPIELGLEIFD